LVKYSPDEFALEFDGIVNFSELAPDALIVVSSTGSPASPGSVPWLSPYVPVISDAASNPTHLITVGCEHLVGKS
jgi:hypothetical protein